MKHKAAPTTRGLRRHLCGFTLTLAVAAMSCAPITSQVRIEPTAYERLTIQPSFKEIQDRIFADKDGQAACIQCHQEGSLTGLVLTPERAYAELVNRKSKYPGVTLVVPGDPDASLLYLAVAAGFDCGGRDRGWAHRFLPAGPCRLEEEEVLAVRAWIERGAPNN